jgi:hypothetical protein
MNNGFVHRKKKKEKKITALLYPEISYGNAWAQASDASDAPEAT